MIEGIYPAKAQRRKGAKAQRRKEELPLLCAFAPLRDKKSFDLITLTTFLDEVYSPNR